MSEPTQRQVDEDIARSMDLFQRADVGEVKLLSPCRPDRILVGLDGSSQDLAAVKFAQQLKQRLGCRVAWLWLPTNDAAAPANDVSAILSDIAADATQADGEENYDQVLAAAAKVSAELIVIPCPFGRDFESLGEDSTGTVIDILAARSEVPLVAIRRPDALGRNPTSHLRIILTGENPAAEHAARWAVGLVEPQGRLELLLLVEQSFYENFRAALHAIQPDVEVSYQDIENALVRTYAKLHVALQRTAENAGFTYELLVRHEGDEQPITPEDPQSHPALMVVALARTAHDSRGEVTDFIRRSPHPVLVVSVGG